MEEKSLFQDSVPCTKAEQLQAKKLFVAEKKKPENGKAFWQPMNAKMDEVLKRMASVGATIEGNGDCILMEKCVQL